MYCLFEKIENKRKRGRCKPIFNILLRNNNDDLLRVSFILHFIIYNYITESKQFIFMILFLSEAALAPRQSLIISFTFFVQPTRALSLSLSLSLSVIRFGKILPLRHNIEKLWPVWKGLFSIWINVELILATFICYWANFHCSKLPNIK